VRAQHARDEVHGVGAGREALGKQPFRRGEPHLRLASPVALVGLHRRRGVVVGVRHEAGRGVVGQVVGGRRGLEVPQTASGVGEELVGAAGAGGQQAPVPRLFESACVERGPAHEHVGHADAVVRGVHRVAHVAESVVVHAEHEQVRRAGQPHDARAVRAGKVEQDVVDGVDDVPVHVVADDVPAAADDGHGRAVIAGVRAVRRRGSSGLVGGELLTAVEDQQAGERHAGAFRKTLEFLHVLRHPAARRVGVGGRLPLGLCEGQAPLGERRELGAEELDGGQHLLARGLADGAAELAVGASGLDVDERDDRRSRIIVRAAEGRPNHRHAPSL
jgi:hypothetical protein